jgi:hypothetical protein
VQSQTATRDAPARPKARVAVGARYANAEIVLVFERTFVADFGVVLDRALVVSFAMEGPVAARCSFNRRKSPIKRPTLKALATPPTRPIVLLADLKVRGPSPAVDNGHFEWRG